VTIDRFDGYVLCGGASRRMGRDKALVEVDGTAMARRVADALRAAGADRVLAIGGDGPALAGRGLRVEPDRWPGEGPLGGLITALADAHRSADVAVVLACDLTDPDPATIARTVEARAHHRSDAAVPVVDGRHQWLHGAWDRRVAGILGDVFGAGERSLAGAALSLRIATLDDVAAAAVHDADRPEDLPVRTPGAGSGAGTPSIGSVQVPEIDISTLRQKLDDGAPLFDVRQPDEYEQGHAPGAHLVPLGEVPDRLGEFPTDETVYVICRSGGRSGKAVEHLRANGVDAVNVAGGTLAWVEAGNAVEQGG